MRTVDTTLSVSVLANCISAALSDDPILKHVSVRGEISGLRSIRTGHWYFDIKDAEATIHCVMWASDAARLSFRPENGDAVVMTGYVGFYKPGGACQLYVRNMRPDGAGALAAQLERLKRRLELEGLFSEERKRPLPFRPRKIAVVTSRTGAVLHDICRVSGSRDPGIPLVLVSVPVQGEGAGQKIAEGLHLAGTLTDVDLIIVGRGGGSMEDLMPFNEECVVRAIAASPVPVISAVGHETDTTLADFAADRRASTPTHAAELAVPPREELLELLENRRHRLETACLNGIRASEMHLYRLRERAGRCSPEMHVRRQQQMLDMLKKRLDLLADGCIAAAVPKLPLMTMRLNRAMDDQVRNERQRLHHDTVHLEAVSPMRVLERGYAIVMDGSRVIGSAAETVSAMRLVFRDGEVNVRKEDV